MKRSLLLIPCLLLLLCSCGGSDGPEGTGKGHITIAASVKADVDEDQVQTRATSVDPTTYTVILEGPQSGQYDYPADDRFVNLPTGNYKVTLTSHPDGMSAPAFDLQIYQGSASVVVEENTNKSAEVVCTQANSGVFFDYGTLTGITPIVAAGAQSLRYEGDNRESKGYFAPGQVAVTFEKEGQAIPVNGEGTLALALAAKRNYCIKLEKSVEGDFSISVTVESVDTETGEKSFALTPGEDLTDYATLNEHIAYYHGGESSGRFRLDIYAEVQAGIYEGLVFEAYADLTDYHDFRIPAGRYKFDDTGSKNKFTFTPGSHNSGTGELTGSFTYLSVSSTIMESYRVTAGEIDVELSGDGVYTVKARLTVVMNDPPGAEYMDPMPLNCKYTGRIAYHNYYYPQTGLQFSDITNTNYTASGTPRYLSTPGSATWSGNLISINDPNDGSQYYRIYNWGDEQGPGYYVDYTNGTLTIDSRTPVGSSGTITGYFVACYIRDDGRVKFLDNYPLIYDRTTRKLKFYGQAENKKVWFGILGRNNYGVAQGFMSELYENPEVALVSARSAASFSGANTLKGMTPDYVTGLYTLKGLSFDKVDAPKDGIYIQNGLQ